MSSTAQTSPAGDRPRARHVLDIPVTNDLIDRWRAWFAPELQPFRVDLMDDALITALPRRQLEPTAEWCDTYFMYEGTWTWLTETEFAALSPRHRRSLWAIRRRPVRPKAVPVWPSTLAAGDAPMIDWIGSGTVRPSRHGEVPAAVWRRAARVLPAARDLAGTFPAGGSGPNCFGTVTAAAGGDAAERLVTPIEFAEWLDRRTEPLSGTAHDHEPGIVFSWTERGHLAHATVSLGDGWMLAKPSQSWSSPRLVQSVRDVVHSWRYPATRLSRWRLQR